MNQFPLTLIEHLKYLGILIGAFIEGPATALAGGFLVKSGFISMVPTIIAHFVGDFSADMVYFFIGRTGGRRIRSRVERLFHISEEEVQKVKKGVDGHQGKIIVLGKLTHFLGLPAIIGMGLSDYSWVRFSVINLIATIIKSIVLVTLGYSTGLLWESQESAIIRAVIIVALIVAVIFFYLHIKKRKNEIQI